MASEFGMAAGNRAHSDSVYDYRKRLLNEHRLRSSSVLHFEASDEWDQYRRCGVIKITMNPISLAEFLQLLTSFSVISPINSDTPNWRPAESVI